MKLHLTVKTECFVDQNVSSMFISLFKHCVHALNFKPFVTLFDKKKKKIEAPGRNHLTSIKISRCSHRYRKRDYCNSGTSDASDYLAQH